MTWVADKQESVFVHLPIALFASYPNLSNGAPFSNVHLIELETEGFGSGFRVNTKGSMSVDVHVIFLWIKDAHKL